MCAELAKLSDELKVRLAKRIRDVEFSVRTHNALYREDVVFVGDLVQRSEDQVLGISGLGCKSLAEIKAYLAPDLALGMRLVGWSREAGLALERDIKACQLAVDGSSLVEPK